MLWSVIICGIGTLEGFGFESDDDKEYIPAADDAGKAGVDSKDEKKQPKQKALVCITVF